MQQKKTEWKCKYCKSSNKIDSIYCTKCYLYDKINLYKNQLHQSNIIYQNYLNKYLYFTPDIWNNILSYLNQIDKNKITLKTLFNKDKFWTDEIDHCYDNTLYHSSFYKNPTYYKIGDCIQYSDNKKMQIGKILAFYESDGVFFTYISKYLLFLCLDILHVKIYLFLHHIELDVIVVGVDGLILMILIIMN